MIYALAVVVLAGLQDPPGEVITQTGDASAFLEIVPARVKEGRVAQAALLVLAGLPDTRSYLGTEVEGALRETIRRAALDDLQTATWADLT